MFVAIRCDGTKHWGSHSATIFGQSIKCSGTGIDQRNHEENLARQDGELRGAF
jgi:hypothetical protein